VPGSNQFAVVAFVLNPEP